MLPTIDPFWLANAVMFIKQTLMIAFYAVGFVLALRRWGDRGRSAHFAATGFGIGLLGHVGGIASMLGADWLLKPPSGVFTGEPDWWRLVIANSLLSLAAIASTVLILFALWFAWRNADPSRDALVR